VSGIAGILGRRPGVDLSPIEAMARAMDGRGPDARVTWRGPRVAIAAAVLGGGGLAETGGWTVALDGEVQNARPLASELAGRAPSPEPAVLVATMCAEVGFLRALARIEGSVAVAAWDGTTGTLWLARDRTGLRALHVLTPGDGTVLFASELGGLLAHPSARFRVPLATVQRFVVLGRLTPPHGWLEGGRTLGPGTCLSWSPAGEEELRWWSLPACPAGAAGSRERWQRSVSYAFELAVRRAAPADEPLALAMGGGLSSHAILVVSPRKRAEPIVTLDVPGTVGVSPDHLASLPDDVPVGDPALVALHAVAEAAWARGARALLVGTGGAEVTAGCAAYRGGARAPGFAVDLARRLLRRGSDADLARSGVRDAELIAGEEGPGGLSDIEALAAACPAEDPASALRWLDLAWGLPEGAWRAVEAAAAAHGLHARVPFADPSLVAVTSQVPMGVWLRGREGRSLFADAMVPMLGDAARAPARPTDWPLAAWIQAADLARGLEEVLEGWVAPEHVAAMRARPAGPRLWRLIQLARWRRRWG
jgi:asparagine synthase (glutamine-hydrolysing)